MKIGIMLRHLNKQCGGIGTYTTKLLEHILSLDRKNEYFFIYKDSGLIGTYDEYPNVHEISKESLSNFVWDQIIVPMIAKKYNIDVLFNPKLSVPLFAKCKTAFVLHGADWFVFPQNYKFHDRLYHKLFSALYCNKADAIISVSKDATNEINKRQKIARAKIKTVYHGVDSNFKTIDNKNRLEIVRRKYHLPDKFILYVGQIYPMKNFSGIIKSFSKLRTRIPHKLVVVGKPTLKYKKELALIDELGLSEDVMCVGWVLPEELPLFYNLADVFLFPSLYEGFGIPLLEAMACGCPIVTSNRGSCPEVAGRAAVIVNPYDTMEIADATYNIITNDVLRQKLVRNGLERIVHFSWESTAKKTLEIITGL